MAVPDAARRSGSLLLRALAVGGFALTAWLLSGGVASADEDHLDVVPSPLEAVKVAVEEQRVATAVLLEDMFAAHLPGAVPAEVPSTLAAQHLPTPLGLDVVFPAREPAYYAPEDGPDDTGYDESDQSGWTGYEYEYSHTGGSHNTRTGQSAPLSNALPTEVYQAKVAAKVAARQAALAPPPPAPEQVAPPVTEQVPAPVEPAPAEVAVEVAAASDLTWEKPQPFAPSPAPQQAPAPTVPTTSAGGGHDNSQGHRGGVIASFTGQGGFAPPTAWWVERRDDWRTPGSTPGLPSTSPD